MQQSLIRVQLKSILKIGGRLGNGTVLRSAFYIQEELREETKVAKIVHLNDMISGRVSHGLTLISLDFDDIFGQAPRLNQLEKGPYAFPYAIGGYNEQKRNVEHDELLLVDFNFSDKSVWSDPEKWSNLQSLSSSRSQFALVSISEPTFM